MNFWDRIKSWLGGRPSTPPTPPAADPPPADAVADAPATTTTFIIPPHMLNTITLSSDITKLYLVDDGKLSIFNLESRNGITIGLIQGQLAVVTALVDDVEPGEGGPTVPDIRPGSSFGGRRSISNPAEARGGGEIDLKLTIVEGTQYSVVYNQGNRAMAIIGATDIISTITMPDNPPTEGPEGNCALHLYDLNDQFINLRRVEDQLVISKVKR